METPGLDLVEAHIHLNHKCHHFKHPPSISYSGVQYKARGRKGRRRGKRREEEAEKDDEEKEAFYLFGKGQIHSDNALLT